MERHEESKTTINFETKCKGFLSATMNWITNRISINFPLTPLTPITSKEIANLPQILQHLLHPFDMTQVHSVHYAEFTKYLFVRLHDRQGEKGLLELKPDFYSLSALKGKFLSNKN